MRSAFSRDRICISSTQNPMFFLAFAASPVAVFTQTLAVLIDNAVFCAFYGEAELASVHKMSVAYCIRVLYNANR